MSSQKKPELDLPTGYWNVNRKDEQSFPLEYELQEFQMVQGW